jgi:hypothetical protein
MSTREIALVERLPGCGLWREEELHTATPLFLVQPEAQTI